MVGYLLTNLLQSVMVKKIENRLEYRVVTGKDSGAFFSGHGVFCIF